MCKKRVVIFSVFVLLCMIFSITGSSFALTLPSSLNWHDYKGENNILQPTPGDYVTSVKNQGNCGNCWAFASTAALESRTLIRRNWPGVDLDLSEQVLISCGNVGACAGGDLQKVAAFLRDTGLPEEECYHQTGTPGICSDACINWENNTYKILSFANVPSTVNDIKRALFYYGPLVTTLWNGSHGVLTVGYNDTDQCFIAKNSGGTGWGQDGYLKIYYSEISYPVYTTYFMAYDAGDIDGDGIADLVDNCPDVYNPLQEDIDQDGIGDICAPSLININIGSSSGSGFNSRVEYCGWYDGQSKKRMAICYQGNWSVDPCNWTASCSSPSGWIGVDDRGTCTSECLGPSITSITQSGNYVGDTVTLYGTNLCGSITTPCTSSMSIGFVNAPGIVAPATSATSDMIIFTIPAGAKTGPIQVILNGTVLNTNKPIVHISPSVASIQQAGFNAGDTVTLSGTNLCGSITTQCTSSMSIGFVNAPGIEAPATSATSDMITFQIPAGAKTGPVRLLLNGTVLDTSKIAVFVTPSSASITSIYQSGVNVGDQVQLQGTNLCGGESGCKASLIIGFVNAPSIKAPSTSAGSAITMFNIPAGAKTGPIQLILNGVVWTTSTQGVTVCACDDGNLCTTDSCDPDTGLCVNTPIANCTTGNNFTIVNPDGSLLTGANDVGFTWDGTRKTSVAVSGQVSNATITSSCRGGLIWSVHDVAIYGPGTYTVFTACAPASPGCGEGTPITFTVGAEEIGGHMLVNWSNYSNADVVIVWRKGTFAQGVDPSVAFYDPDGDGIIDPIPMWTGGCGVNPANKEWDWMSKDWDGDGINGYPMVDGSFRGSSANFNMMAPNFCADAATHCNDNNACTVDSCNATTGVCVYTPVVCNDNNLCTIDTCDPATGCVYTPVVNGTSCSDGNLCNGAETCQGGICTAGTPLVCNDNNICTTDTCNPAAGCVYTPVANGTSCSDGNLCNGAETCQGGICKAGTPLVCNDNNLCTIDTCDPVKGCVYTPKCDDNNVCTTDTCNARTGACTHTNNTLSCDDGNACTTNDKCSGGVCKGTAKNCSDNNACTTDTCDQASGVCGHTAIVCNDNKSCTTDACNPASGCVYTAVANGTVCTEVANGRCQTGTCVNIDLVPTAMTATKSGTTGVLVSETVKNQGTSNAGSFTITYYLSTNTTYESGTDIVLASSSNGTGTCSRTVTSLASGASNPITNKTCYKPSGAVAGQKYYLLVRDDSANAVPESDETNNVKPTTNTISW